MDLGLTCASLDDLISRSLPSSHPQRPFFQIRSHPQVLGISIPFEATIPSTVDGVLRLGLVQLQAGVSGTCSSVGGHVPQGDDGLWLGKVELGVG